LFFVTQCVLLISVMANNNGLGALPPMGWNTWCTAGPCVLDYCNETEVMSVAKAMSENGMQKLGFTYVNLDDCWIAKTRDNVGKIAWDPARFPSGLPSLITSLHKMGFLFGLYCSAGYGTCVGNRPGSYGHYDLDADTFASWGVDYVKMDWCQTTGLDQQTQTDQFAQSLNKTGRQIWFNFHCGHPPQEWCAKDGNSYRIGPDHIDEWSNSMKSISALKGLGKSAGPGHWNDPDFLETGGQGCSNGDPHCPGQTDVEYRTIFSIWCIVNAPLLVSTDVRVLTPIMKEVLLNKELIDVNQDKLATSGDVIATVGCPGCLVWGKPLADGSWAVGLFNSDNVAHSMMLDFTDVGKMGATLMVRDLWKHADLGSMIGNVTAMVGPHETVVYKLSP